MESAWNLQQCKIQSIQKKSRYFVSRLVVFYGIKKKLQKQLKWEKMSYTKFKENFLTFVKSQNSALILNCMYLKINMHGNIKLLLYQHDMKA